jgi:pyruvate,water dikinase
MQAISRGATSLEEFVRRFGHRCGREFELAAPRWREDTRSLCAQIGQLGDTELLKDPALRSQSTRRAAEASLDDLQTHWGPIVRELIRSRLFVARKLFPLREQTKDLLMREYELLRTPLVELGHRLDLDDGIFYLHSSEISAAAEGQPVSDRIEERRRQHTLQQQLQLPHIVLGSQLKELLGQRKAATDISLRGFGVSPGVVSGRVRVVSNADDLAAIEPADVLVAGSLDAAWTIAFARAAALVAERGASLSHGAIVARELGVPAVVNVAGCTTQLRTGQVVKVDGARGFVVPLKAHDKTSPGVSTGRLET